MTKIILTTLNAKYIHANLGLRYLYANLNELQDCCEIKEFTIKNRAIDIVEQLLESKPEVIGFGVYIWNTQETAAVVAQLKAVAPEIKVILGGPEISYETDDKNSSNWTLFNAADYIICGAADLAFYRLCRDLIDNKPPANKILSATPVKLNEIKLPYEYYSDEDIKHRLIYVEASRGCPFKCEFCLSSLDKTSYPFELDCFLSEMERLYLRGLKHFKFVDRTFNLNIRTSLKILDFFLQKNDKEIFLHFEVIPDHLPEKLKYKLKQFSAGSLQLEIGIQSFNPQVQSNISRKQNNDKSKESLRWIRDNTHAHIHADLIFGLPGETLQSFEQSFNQLYQCHPHEVQMGILKRLKGTPVIRHTKPFDLRFNPLPPFNILSTDKIDFNTMQRLNRFARYWDMIGNSGRFKNCLPEILSENIFADFMALMEWIYARTGQTHQINLKKLYEYVAQAVAEIFPDRHASVIQALETDYANSKLKGNFKGLRLVSNPEKSDASQNRRSIRQQRHSEN